MAEFVRPEDWGLGAIVGGSSISELWNTIPSTHHHHPSSWFNTTSLLEIPEDDCHDLLFNLPCLFDSTTAAASVVLTDELQELCKPFYSSQSSPPGHNTVSTSSFSACKEMKQEPEPDQTEEFCGEVAQMDKNTAAADAGTTAYMPKYKRKKNQHKRVVLRVTAEDLTSDKWAWRKYGQKPIKGSPYPRSYYRCSSSKGCLARKQVEQSFSDPGMFIITYTAEHNHSQPTRRNALSGTIRHKFGATIKSAVSNTNSKGAKKRDSGICSPSPTFSDLSPGPLVAEAKFVESQMNKNETERMQMVDELMINRKNGILIPEVMFDDDDDDFFSCLNDLDGFISQWVDGNSSTGTLSSESEFS